MRCYSSRLKYFSDFAAITIVTLYYMSQSFAIWPRIGAVFVSYIKLHSQEYQPCANIHGLRINFTVLIVVLIVAIVLTRKTDLPPMEMPNQTNLFLKIGM